MINITIALPDISSDFENNHNLPSLKLLLDKAKVNGPKNSFEEGLLDLFYPQQHFLTPSSFASVCGLAEGLSVNEDWWLRIDPVELVVDGAGIYLIGNSHLEISEHESEQLITSLQSFLATEKIQLIATSPSSWYLRLCEDPQIQTFSISSSQGKDIRNYLPLGAKQKEWRRFLTEIQMILYNSEVNQQRIQNNQPQINSIWFWGEGKLPSLLPDCIVKKVWSDSVLGRGFAMLNHIALSSPISLTNCFQEMKESGNYLIVLDRKTVDMEASWFAPLLAANKKKFFRHLKLFFADSKLYSISRRWLW